MILNIDMDKAIKFSDNIADFLNDNGNSIEENLISLQRVVGRISLKIASNLDIEVDDKEKFIKGFVSAFGDDISRFFNARYQEFKGGTEGIVTPSTYDNRQMYHEKTVKSLQEKSVVELFDELIKTLKDLENETK